MTQEQLLTGKNLEIATDTVSLVKDQLKLLKWRPSGNQEMVDKWEAQEKLHTERLLNHVGVDPLALVVIKHVISMFESLLPAPVVTIIKKLLKLVGIEV